MDFGGTLYILTFKKTNTTTDFNAFLISTFMFPHNLLLISAEFALFTLSFIRNFQNKSHFMGVLHNLLRGFNSAGSNKQENNTLRQKS